jgi:tRNA1Val (adenine37-N6)-methyltransferase
MSTKRISHWKTWRTDALVELGKEGLVLENERLDDLVRDNLKIIQDPRFFRFSMDAVLLADFVTVRKGDSILDLGTGTGVIPLLLAAKTGAAEIHGLEIQGHIADMARRSVSYNNLEHKVSIRHGDLRQVSSIYGFRKFDVVVSNPPYTSVGGGLINPADSLAIARHEIMCSLNDVIEACSRTVNTGGRVAVVHRPARLVDVFCLMRENGLEPKRLRTVHPRQGAKPNLILVEALKGGGKELDLLPPLFIYKDDGDYTEEVKAIYDGSAGDREGTPV